MADYENMTIEELEAENIRLSSERERIRARQRELNAVLDRKLAERSLKAKLGALSSAEQVALIGLARAEGQ